MKQSRCFSGIPLLILWYNTCCLFDLWFIVFSKSGLCIWKFLVHILLMTNLKDFEYYIASMWKESNCIVIWTFFGIAFLWDWSENCFLWPLLSFQNLDLLYTSSVFRIHCLSFPEYQWVVSERRGASHRCLLCNPEHRAVHKDNWKKQGNLGTLPLWCWHPSDTCFSNSGSSPGALGLLLWPMWCQLSKRLSWSFRADNGLSFILGTLQTLPLLVLTRTL